MQNKNSINSQSYQKISFITDVQKGEPDILKPVRYEHLRILDLDDAIISVSPAPLGGWEHKLLVVEADNIAAKTNFGANAYLGSTWVGSTEV
jgi:hypothetical protein